MPYSTLSSKGQTTIPGEIRRLLGLKENDRILYEIEDGKVAEDLYAFHVPVFQKVPRPSFPGWQALREFLVGKYPAAMSLKESDIADSSFIDELERSGFIDRLYAADTK